MKKLRIGVIGCGHMGCNHVRIISRESCFDFIGIFDKSIAQAKKCSEQYGVKAYSEPEELLQEVEAVVIAIPSSLHKEMAFLVADHHVHALIEKPIALNVVDAEEIVNKYNENGLKLSVGHVERFNPVIVELEKIIDTVGQIFYIEAHRYSPFSGGGRITDTSVVEDLMVHDIDLVCGLMAPSRVTDIRSNGERIRSDRTDFATCMLDFGETAHAVINASRVSQNKERSLTVHTPECCIYADLLTRTLMISKNTNIIVDGLNANFYTQDGVIQKIFVPGKEPLREELLSFYDSVVYDRPVKVDGEAGLKAVKICEEVLRKIDNGKIK